MSLLGAKDDVDGLQVCKGYMRQSFFKPDLFSVSLVIVQFLRVK